MLLFNEALHFAPAEVVVLLVAGAVVGICTTAEEPTTADGKTVDAEKLALATT